MKISNDKKKYLLHKKKIFVMYVLNLMTHIVFLETLLQKDET